MAAEASSTPTELFADLGRFNVQAMDLPQLLQRITEMARHAVAGAAEVSITLIQDENAYTAATTGGVAPTLDAIQYEHMTGPCMDAARGDLEEALVITDTHTEARWPTYTPSAVEEGVYGTLSISLPVQQPVVGSLNFYAADTDAFDDADVQIARVFAGYAAVAVANAHLYANTAALAGQMEEAMRFRTVIEQAKGILAAEQRCSPAEAFTHLKTRSANENRKVRDLAADIVTSVTSPQ